MILHQHPAQRPVRLAGPEQNAVRHDHRGPPARFQQPQEQGQEQQLGLPRLDHRGQILGHAVGIQRAGKRRVGQHQRIGAGIARTLLRKTVPIPYVRAFHPVQQHVHAADAQHGAVEIEPVKHLCVKMHGGCRIAQHVRMTGPQIFAGGHQKAGGAAGRVHDAVARAWRHHLHHQPDDVARRAELAVLPGGGDLAEHVFVHVALGVAILHRHAVQHVHHPAEQRRGGDGEARVPHVVRVGAAIPAQRAQEGEDVLAEDGEHVGRCGVDEAGPAQRVVGLAARVRALGEDAPAGRLAGAGGPLFPAHPARRCGGWVLVRSCDGAARLSSPARQPARPCGRDGARGGGG